MSSGRTLWYAVVGLAAARVIFGAVQQYKSFPTSFSFPILSTDLRRLVVNDVLERPLECGEKCNVGGWNMKLRE